MAWFRRRRRDTPSTELSTTSSQEVAVRTERALVALAVHARQLGDRVEQIERRLLDVEHLEDTLASHDEVLEARVHSAKVSAEVSRLSINLRAQIDDLRAKLPTERDQRATTLAETIVDLSDDLDTGHGDVAHGGTQGDWARTG